MSAPLLALGVDSGNTKTEALLVGADGTVHAYGRAGVGDIYRGEEAAAAEVLRAVAAVDPPDGTGSSFCLAGVDWPDDAAYWQDVLRRERPGLPDPDVANDGVAVLHSARPDGPGVAVVAGTGAAVSARGPDGHEVSLCAWLRGELGSMGLGTAALDAVALADLEGRKGSPLTERFLATYGVPDVAAAVRLFHARSLATPRWRLAEAAPAVVAAAADGDAVAAGLVREQAEALGRYVEVAARRAGLDPTGAFPVTTGGTLLSRPSAYADAVGSAVRERFPAAEVLLPVVLPVGGAAVRALLRCGVRLGPEGYARMADGLRAVSAS